MRITNDHRRLMEDMGVGHNHFKMLCDAIRVGLEFTPLCDREKSIVLAVIDGGRTFAEIGKEWDLSQERVRQIYNKALRRLRYAFRLYVSEQDILHAELAQLRADNEQLRLKNESLLEAIATAQIEPPKEIHEAEQLKILSTPISELEISVRLQNLCRCAELVTLGDVIRVGSKREFLRYRNFGRKSLTELENILAEYGYELKD